MKVLLYRGDEKMFKKSGIGRAMKHQEEALRSANVNFTVNVDDEYDIVHLNTITPQSFIIAKKAKKTGKKVIYHAHSTEEDFKNSFAFSNVMSPYFKKWLFLCYGTADLLLTPTPYSRKILKSSKLKMPIVSISNGVNLSKFKYDTKKVLKFNRYFGIKPTDRVIISVGHYFERKGISDFFEVASNFQDVKFIWFGYTSPAAQSESVRRAIKNKPANVILPGYISGDIIQGAFMSADMFFFPSYEETEGIVILEALAARCQVLIREIGTYSSWLNDEKNCFMGSSNEEFSRIIEEFLTGRKKDTIDSGYATAQSRSIEKIGLQMKKIYEDLLAE